MSVYTGRFAGRRAVITGGASGAGLEVATRIIREGGQVCAWDLNRDALSQASSAARLAHTEVVDVADPAGVARAAKSTVAALGGVDILIACAGITGPTTPVQEFPIDGWKRTIDINLNGVFYCCREVVPLMLAGNYGRIVVLSSVAGKEGNPNASAYSASKAAVIGFVKSLGKELAQTGVRVNCLTPATFASPMLGQLPQSQIDYMKSKIPIGRLGELSEVAAIVCWMASEECSFTTASTFDLSGGRTTY